MKRCIDCVYCSPDLILTDFITGKDMGLVINVCTNYSLLFDRDKEKNDKPRAWGTTNKNKVNNCKHFKKEEEQK